MVRSQQTRRATQSAWLALELNILPLNGTGTGTSTSTSALSRQVSGTGRLQHDLVPIPRHAAESTIRVDKLEGAETGIHGLTGRQ
jgi:hypothetical protein